MSEQTMARDWTKLRLGDICSKIGSGSTPRGGNSVYRDDGVSLIRSQNILNEHFSREGLAFIDDDLAEQLRGVTVAEGDVLLNITGDSVARVCQAPADVLPARVNQHVAIIRPDSSILDPKYLRYYLVNPAMQQELLAMAGAGATRNALTKGMIEQLEVVMPEEVGDQRAIAHILGTLDNKIELNRRMNETLEAMARAIFKSWFVDFDPVCAKAGGEPPESICRRLGLASDVLALFPDSLQDSELGEIPVGWDVGSLDSVLVLQRGFDLPASERLAGRYPILAASGPSGTHHEFMVRGPGVTTGRSGVLGKVFYVHEDYWPLNTSLWVKEFKRAKPAYAFHLLQGLDFNGLNAGSAVPTLNRNHAHGIHVLMPSQGVIEAFESIAVMALAKQRANLEQSVTIAGIRDALLPKLLSGQLPVENAEREAATV
jgi:type I restriction enzyme S subunit